MSNQTDMIITPQREGAGIRTGTVVGFTAQTVSVDVGGAVLVAGYLRWYVPILEDLVAVGRQDASWLCLGSIAGYGPNQVPNASFELDGDLIGTVPTHWFVSNLSGAGTVSVLTDDIAPNGTHVAVINPGAVARDVVLYSSAFDVAPGERWDISGYAAGLNPAGGALTNVLLIAIWGPDSTTLYPGAPGGAIVDSLTNIGDSTFIYMEGRVTVPATASFMRVGFRTNPALPIGVGARLDFVVARRVF